MHVLGATAAVTFITSLWYRLRLIDLLGGGGGGDTRLHVSIHLGYLTAAAHMYLYFQLSTYHMLNAICVTSSSYQQKMVFTYFCLHDHRYKGQSRGCGCNDMCYVHKINLLNHSIDIPIAFATPSNSLCKPLHSDSLCHSIPIPFQ